MSLIKSERRTAWPVEAAWSEERVDRAFRDMLRDFFSGGVFLDRFFEGRPGLPRVEEFVEDGSCVIRAELPGIDPDKDVEISLVDDTLVLRAHREERTEDERPGRYRSEFHYGSVERHIPLPEGTTGADVRATYTDGILEVRVPMPKPAAVPASTRIPVERG